MQNLFCQRICSNRRGLLRLANESESMTVETKTEIMNAWHSYLSNMQRRHKKNEGSTAQDEDYRLAFKEGIINHDSLSKKEKVELLSYMGMA